MTEMIGMTKKTETLRGLRFSWVLGDYFTSITTQRFLAGVSKTFLVSPLATVSMLLPLAPSFSRSALTASGLLVGGAGEQELGGVVHDAVREELEVGLLTVGNLGGAEVEVDGGRGGDLRFDSGEAAVLEEVGLAVNQVLERGELVLQVGDLVLELGVLTLEGGDLVLQGIVLSLGERHRDDDRHDGAEAVG